MTSRPKILRPNFKARAGQSPSPTPGDLLHLPVPNTTPGARVAVVEPISGEVVGELRAQVGMVLAPSNLAERDGHSPVIVTKVCPKLVRVRGGAPGRDHERLERFVYVPGYAGRVLPEEARRWGWEAKEEASAQPSEPTYPLTGDQLAEIYLLALQAPKGSFQRVRSAIIEAIQG